MDHAWFHPGAVFFVGFTAGGEFAPRFVFTANNLPQAAEFQGLHEISERLTLNFEVPMPPSRVCRSPFRLSFSNEA